MSSKHRIEFRLGQRALVQETNLLDGDFIPVHDTADHNGHYYETVITFADYSEICEFWPLKIYPHYKGIVHIADASGGWWLPVPDDE